MLDYFYTNIMQESEQYEDMPTDAHIESQLNNYDDPFGVVEPITLRKAG